MKAILASILLSAATMLGADLTNGVFYVDNNVQCVLVEQSGQMTTNRLEAGKTYKMGDALAEITTQSPTTIYFSDGPMIQTGTETKLAILSFDQEVENITSTPAKAKFGYHTLNLSLDRGEFSIVYPNKNEYSRVNASTQYAAYELVGGKYYFRVYEQSVVAYVMDGGMTVHGDKSRTDDVEKGKLAIAVPFLDVASGLQDKIVTSFKQAESEEIEVFAKPLIEAEQRFLDVDFFVIGGKVIGFQLK